MGSVIGKHASLTPVNSRQSSFDVIRASNMTHYSFEAKQEAELKDGYSAGLNQWTDEVTYKYLDIALTADLETNPLPAVGDFDPTTAYMDDFILGGSIDEALRHGSPSRSDFLNLSSTASDCSRTNGESEDGEKSCSELENKILQDYDQAKVTRSLLSEGPAAHTTSDINGIQLVLNSDASVPNTEDTASTRLSNSTPNEVALMSAIKKKRVFNNQLGLPSF